MADFLCGFSNQKERAEVTKTPKAVKTYLGLWFSPLLEENGLTDARQHQVGPRCPLSRPLLGTA